MHPTGANQVNFPNKDTQFQKGKSGHATIVGGLFQALQGDEKWAKLLREHSYGNVPDKIIGDAEKPIAHTITLKIDNS
jgi:hypothetical protein